MTNIVFSSALQAPIALSNPAGSLALASDPSLIIAQANPIPNQCAVALVGAAVRLALAMSTQAAALTVAGVTPGVVSGIVTPRSSASGVLSYAGVAPTLGVVSNSVLTHPRSIAVLYGGNQGYGCDATTTPPYQNWLTAAVGSAAYNFIQNVGAYDGAMLAGINEGTAGDWDSSHQRNRENLTLALGKSGSLTYSVKLNNNRKTLCWYYHVMNEAQQSATGTGYDRRNQQILNMNGWVYTLAGGAGSLINSPAGGGLVLSNYSIAWPGAIGPTAQGASVVGSVYGSTRSSPTGAQGVARMNGNYAVIKIMMAFFKGDTSFVFNNEMGSQSCAGPLLDNAFYGLDGAGNITNASLNGVTIANGTAPAYPTLNTPQEVLARGVWSFFDQIKTMIASFGNPGMSVIPAANMGQYCNKSEFGTACLTGGLANMMVMGFIEAAIGASFSPEWRIHPSAPTGNYALQLKDNLYLLQDFLIDHPQTPRRPVLAVILPPLTGTSTCQFPVLTGGAYALQTVNSGDALEFQIWRYAFALAMLCGADIGPSTHNYDYALLRYMAELGDDGLTLTNVPKGWMGQMAGPRPTSPTWNQGPMGVWSQTYTGGYQNLGAISVWNPRGNGVQTVTLPGTYQALNCPSQAPTINNGGNFTSVTLQDGDGWLGRGPISTFPDYTWSTIVAGSLKSAANGFAVPVVFNSGTVRAPKTYNGGPIFVIEQPGPVDVYNERPLGTSGVMTMTAATFTSFNAVPGTHYTALPTAQLSWADGEEGWKKFTINVTAIPQGFGLIGITLGGSAYHSTLWIYLKGTGRAPNAKFVVTSNGANAFGNTQGAGTLASPWQSVNYASQQMSAAGVTGPLYLINNGPHKECGPVTAPGSGQAVSIKPTCNQTNAMPFIIMPDPSNTSTVVIDNGLDSGGFSAAPAFNFQNSSGSGLWICGLHMSRSPLFWGSDEGTNNNWSDCVVWQCEIDSCLIDGKAGYSNAHCLRFDYTVRLIVQDCFIHKAFTTEAGTSNSYFPSVPAGFQACAGGFRSKFIRISHCKFQNGQYGVIVKEASDTNASDHPPDITHCIGSQMQNNAGAGGNLVGYPVQGLGWKNGLVRYNVYDGSTDLTTSQLFVYGGDIGSGQCDHLDVYQNTIITGSKGGGGIIALRCATNIRIFNNIDQGDTALNGTIKLNSPTTGLKTQLEISNWNMLVNCVAQFVTDYSSNSTYYNGVPAFRAAPIGAFLAAQNELNSIVTTTVPTYNNASLGDYRYHNTLGHSGRAMGIGDEYAGIVYNFLNSDLPLVNP